MSNFKVKISKKVLPKLMKRSKEIMEKFNSDEKLYGSIPLSRLIIFRIFIKKLYLMLFINQKKKKKIFCLNNIKFITKMNQFLLY